jgi:hypothetical protein
MASTISTEPLTGDSLSQYFKSMTNVLGQGGQETFNTGQRGYAAGVQDFGPALDYWNSILSGNKSQMETSIAPEKNDILSQYRAKRKQLAATGSRSGGTNESVAQSEFSQAGDIASLLQKLRPQAAQQSSDIAGKLAQLGLSESGIGNDQMFQALAAQVARGNRNAATDSHNLDLLTGGLKDLAETGGELYALKMLI